MNLTPVDLIFSLCEVLILLSYVSKNILSLRLLSILGMLCYVIGGLIAGYETPGMKSVIIFSLVNMVVNIYQALIIILERVPIFLPENIKHLYNSYFKMMSPDEFNTVYKLADIKKYHIHDTLSVQGEPINELIIIVSGHVNVIKNDLLVATLSPGDFIGEMSFILGGAASASVEIADDKTECIVWEKATLMKQLHDEPQLYLKFKQVIAMNLVKKLNKSSSE